MLLVTRPTASSGFRSRQRKFRWLGCAGAWMGWRRTGGRWPERPPGNGL